MKICLVLSVSQIDFRWVDSTLRKTNRVDSFTFSILPVCLKSHVTRFRVSRIDSCWTYRAHAWYISFLWTRFKTRKVHVVLLFHATRLPMSRIDFYQWLVYEDGSCRTENTLPYESFLVHTLNEEGLCFIVSCDHISGESDRYSWRQVVSNRAHGCCISFLVRKVHVVLLSHATTLPVHAATLPVWC